MDLRTRGILAFAALLYATAAFGFASVAMASPASVAMHLPGCDGDGFSWLANPLGDAETDGCADSVRYISATITHANLCPETSPGAWFSSDVQVRNQPGACSGSGVSA